MGWLARRAVVFPALGALGLACAQIAGEHSPVDDGSSGTNGDGGSNIDPASIQITPNDVDLGNAPCGAPFSGKGVPITLVNNGPIPAPYAITIAEGSPFRVEQAATGTVPPNSNLALTLAVTANDVGATTTDVTVTVGPVVKSITAHVNGVGSKLVILPAVADLGDVRAASGGAVDLELRNVGTEPLPLTKFAFDGDPAGFSITWNGATTALNIQGNSSIPAHLAIAPGTADTTATATLHPVFGAGAHLCGAPPSLPVRAHLITTNVTISPADFGQQDCASAPPPTTMQDIVISNYSASTLTATATLKAGSQFAFAGPKMTTVAAGSSTTPTTGKIPLVLNAIGATVGSVSENVDVFVSAQPALGGGDDGARTTTARVDVRGAVISVSPNPETGFFAFCDWQGCNTDEKPVMVTNSGNDTVSIGISQKSATGASASSWILSGNSSVPPGAHTWVMYFQPNARCSSCDVKYDFARAGGGALCAPVPTFDFQGSTN